MKRSFGIDLVRALSILLVIIRHYGYTPGFNIGYYAIEYLFVISGFLIGQILFNDFYSSDTIEASSLKRFMIRRWFRILPLYYFAIFLKFAIDPSIGWNILYYVFFLQNHFYGITFYPETWTLVIDEWFYLVIPVMLFLFMRLVSFRKGAVAMFIVAIIILINILRTIWVFKTDTHWEGLTGNVPFRQDTLLMGVILAFVKMHYNSWFKKMNTAGFFAFAMLAFIAYVFVMYQIRTPTDAINNHFWTRTINFSLCSFIIVITLPFIENSINAFKPKSLGIVNSVVVWGSKLSYALYLMHGEVLVATTFILGPLSMNSKWVGLVAIVFTTLVSYILYQFLEKRCLIIRDKYFPDRPYAKQ